LMSGCSESINGPSCNKMQLSTTSSWQPHELVIVYDPKINNNDKKYPDCSIGGIFTNTRSCGGLRFAYASSSTRGSNNKLSVVVKGPAAIIC
jgi:hypothetical protein